jgi:hypothetical protein
MNEETPQERSVVGDWKGSLYSIRGQRFDWQLSLWRNGSYCRRVTGAGSQEINETGTWEVTEDGDVLVFNRKDGHSSRWRMHDLTSLERARTLLVLRHVALASRNLPILLYRIHPLPGPPVPLDAHGFEESNPD